MAYGQSMSAVYPTIGQSFATEAADLDTLLRAIVSTLEAKVTPSGFTVNADVAFNPGATAFAATGLLKASFTPAAALAAVTHPNSLYLDTNGNLYLNDNNGNQIQITTGGSVNVSAAGGITGSGYGTGGVEVNWVAASTKYRMRKGTGTNDFANVELLKLIMNDGSANFLTLESPALASDQTITLPVNPASQALLQISSAGAITASNTLAPGGGTLAITGALTVSTTIVASSTITGTTITGTALRYSADDSINMNACAAQGNGSYSSAVGSVWVLAATEVAIYPIVVPVGTRIIGYAASALVNTGGDTFDVRLFKQDESTGITATQVGTTQTSGSTAATLYTPAETLGTPDTVGSGEHFYIQVLAAANAGNIDNYFARVVVDRPT